ncbi:hypothetical protein ACUH78_14250, partial [Thauera sp. ZXT1-4]|uniref:hypothetical protein n=1 Tax=Thauera sp. ZXT1-4 TaxID=3460294 RepID=UPI0040409546
LGDDLLQFFVGQLEAGLVFVISHVVHPSGLDTVRARARRRRDKRNGLRPQGRRLFRAYIQPFSL